MRRDAKELLPGRAVLERDRARLPQLIHHLGNRDRRPVEPVPTPDLVRHAREHLREPVLRSETRQYHRLARDLIQHVRALLYPGDARVGVGDDRRDVRLVHAGDERQVRHRRGGRHRLAQNAVLDDPSAGQLLVELRRTRRLRRGRGHGHLRRVDVGAVPDLSPAGEDGLVPDIAGRAVVVVVDERRPLLLFLVLPPRLPVVQGCIRVGRWGEDAPSYPADAPVLKSARR